LFKKIIALPFIAGVKLAEEILTDEQLFITDSGSASFFTGNKIYNQQFEKPDKAFTKCRVLVPPPVRGIGGSEAKNVRLDLLI
jgi:hypothetical protein